MRYYDKFGVNCHTFYINFTLIEVLKTVLISIEESTILNPFYNVDMLSCEWEWVITADMGSYIHRHINPVPTWL